MTTPVIQFQNVTKEYDRNVALADISVTIPSGKIIGLIGPNGSGKSTLLKLVAGLLRPSKGTVFVRGKEASRLIAKEVAYLSDTSVLYSFFTVQEMICFYGEMFQDVDIDKAFKMANELELSPELKVGALSKGCIGRLKIVLALSRKAPLILLDEPLAGLDLLARESIIRTLISFLNLEYQTLLLTTHEVGEVEPILDQVIYLQGGRIGGVIDVETLRGEQGLSVLDWMRQKARS